MNKKALIFGLTAGLYAFVFTWIGDGILVWLELSIPRPVRVLLLLAASFVAALKLADMVEGEDEPPPVLAALLLFSAVFYLLAQLLIELGLGFGAGRLGSFAVGLAQWCLVGTCLLITRFIQHRMMLFLGIAAFAMQFHAAMALGLFVMRLPVWALELITFIVAAVIALWMCFREEAPAERVGNPVFLWLFSAAGTMSLIITVHDRLLPDYVQEAVWLLFLVSFMLLVRQIEPDEPEDNQQGSQPPPPRASLGLLFLVFVALFSAVGSVFHFSETVGEWIPYTVRNELHLWIPVVINAIAALSIVLVLRLPERVRPDAPGRLALLVGVILYFLGVLAGGSLFGVMSAEGKFFDFLATMVWLVLLAGPVLIAAQVLMGIGLLRILFSLRHRPMSGIE